LVYKIKLYLDVNQVSLLNVLGYLLTGIYIIAITQEVIDMRKYIESLSSITLIRNKIIHMNYFLFS